MAASDKVIEANRRNAQLSTGPRTPEGKARSAMNAVKPDCTGQAHAFDPEVLAKLQQFRESLLASLQPADELENMLLERVVIAHYELLKLAAARAAYLTMWEDTARLVISPSQREALGLEPQIRSYTSMGLTRYQHPAVPTAVALAVMLNSNHCPLQTMQQHEARIEVQIYRSLRQLRLLQQRRERTATKKITKTNPFSWRATAKRSFRRKTNRLGRGRRRKRKGNGRPIGDTTLRFPRRLGHAI